jgi:hypothetical protein
MPRILDGCSGTRLNYGQDHDIELTDMPCNSLALLVSPQSYTHVVQADRVSQYVSRTPELL